MPETIEGIGWEVVVVSRTDPTKVVAHVPRWTRLDWTTALGGLGSGRVEILRDDRIFKDALPLDAVGTILEDETIWKIYHEGIHRHSFFCEDVDKTHVDARERPVVKVTGRSTGKILEHATVLPPSYPAHTKRTHEWNATSAMRAWKLLYDQAVARGAIPSYFTTTITTSLDSAGVAWSDSGDLVVPPGGNLLDLLGRYAEVAGKDWMVTEAHVLVVRDEIGARREGQVAFHVAGAIVELGEEKTRRDVKTHVYAEASDGGVGTSSDAAAATKWGRREAWVSANDAKNQATANSYASKMLGTLKAETNQITVKVNPDDPARRPFVDYALGDWVRLESDEVSSSNAPTQFIVKIVGLSVHVDENGKTELELVTNTALQRRNQRVKNALARLGEDLLPTDLGGPLDFSGGGVGEGTPLNPATSVVTEVTWGQLPLVGADNAIFARGDHTHGTPGDPVPPHEAASNPHTVYVREVTSSSPVTATTGQNPIIGMPAATTISPGHFPAADKETLEGRTSSPTPSKLVVRDTTGTAEFAVGTLAGHPVRRDDARLTDARTPTAHAASHQPGGADAIPTAAPGTIAYGATPSTGTAITLARSDHVHGSPGTPVTSFNTRTGAVTLLSSDVTTALGYTPVNKAGDTMIGTLQVGSTYPRAEHSSTGSRYMYSATEGVDVQMYPQTVGGIGRGLTFTDVATGETLVSACYASSFWDIGPRLRTSNSNLLSGNAADIESSAAGWPLGEGMAAPGTQSSEQKVSPGFYSLKLTSNAAGDMVASTANSNAYTDPMIAVAASTEYTMRAQFRAAVTARSVRCELRWYTSADVVISTTVGATVADTTTGWVEATLTATSPSNAAKVACRVVVVSVASGESHYVDKISLRAGPANSTTAWIPGGGGVSGKNLRFGITGSGADTDQHQIIFKHSTGYAGIIRASESSFDGGREISIDSGSGFAYDPATIYLQAGNSGNSRPKILIGGDLTFFSGKKFDSLLPVSAGFYGLGSVWANQGIVGGYLGMGFDQLNNTGHIACVSEGASWRTLRLWADTFQFHAGGNNDPRMFVTASGEVHSQGSGSSFYAQDRLHGAGNKWALYAYDNRLRFYHTIPNADRFLFFSSGTMWCTRGEYRGAGEAGVMSETWDTQELAGAGAYRCASVNNSNSVYRQHEANPHVNASDMSVKRNVRPMVVGEATAKIRATKPFRFTWAEGQGLPNAGERIGLDANAVPAEIASKMGPFEDGTQLMGIDTGAISALLWGAVLELDERLRFLENRSPLILP